MVILGDSRVMIFYVGEFRMIVSMNGEGWEVLGVRIGFLFYVGVYGVEFWGIMELFIFSRVFLFIVFIYIGYLGEDGFG